MLVDLLNIVQSTDWPTRPLFQQLLRKSTDFQMSEIDDPEIVARFVLEVSIPALRIPQSANDGADDSLAIPRYHFGEVIPKVVSQLGGASRNGFYNIVCSELVDLVNDITEISLFNASLRVIALVGFRNENILNALLCMITNSPERAYRSLVTAIGLGIPEGRRSEFAPFVAIHLKERSMLEGIEVIAALARQRWLSSDLVEFITLLLRSLPLGENDRFGTSSEALTIIGYISKCLSDDSGIQSEQWGTVSYLVENLRQEFLTVLELHSAAISSIDHRTVIVDLLGWHAEQSAEFLGNEILWYRLYLRLLECFLPETIAGWSDVFPARLSILDAIQRHACLDTGDQSSWATIKHDVKKSAWDVLMCIAPPDLMSFGVSAAQCESNPYIAQHIYRRLAVWPGTTFTQYEEKLLQQTFDVEVTKNNGELCRRFGAVDMVASVANWSAFELLFSARVFSDGVVFNSTGDAVAAVARHLAKNESQLVLQRLLAILASGPEHSRDLSTYVLRSLADDGFRFEGRIDLLLEFAFDSTLAEWSRESILEAIRYANPTLTASQEAKVKDLANSSEGRVRHAAIDLLIWSGLPGSLDEEFAKRMLNLVRTDSEWLLSTEMAQEDLVFSYGLLFVKSPRNTEKVISSIIEGGESTSLFPLIGFLVDVGKHLPRSVANAIISRIQKRTNEGFVEKDLIRIVVLSFPELIVSVDWLQYSDHWHPEARLALAEVFGEISNESAVMGTVLGTLTVFAGDGRFEVRRAAMRSISLVSPVALCQLIVSWSESEYFDLRMRAAEACTWLGRGDDTFSTLQKLQLDEESNVREAASDAFTATRERLLASKYLLSIQEGLSNGKDVPELFAIGKALEHVGSDYDCVVIEKLRESRDFQLYQRNWLYSIEMGIRKRWERVTSKWPKPWLRLQGTVETVDAVVYITGTMHKVKATLWMNCSKRAPRLISWGGLVSFEEPDGNFSRLFNFGNSDHWEISVNEGPRSHALYRSNLDDGSILITGSGPYPKGPK